MFDELFLFEDAPSATAFYESGFLEWESFLGGEDEGCGFQEVSLYRSGTRIASKSCAPSLRTKKDENEDLWVEWADSHRSSFPKSTGIRVGWRTTRKSNS